MNHYRKETVFGRAIGPLNGELMEVLNKTCRDRPRWKAPTIVKEHLECNFTFIREVLTFKDSKN